MEGGVLQCWNEAGVSKPICRFLGEVLVGTSLSSSGYHRVCILPAGELFSNE